MYPYEKRTAAAHVGIVTVTFNSGRSCCQIFYAHSRLKPTRNFRLCAVDNVSTDDTVCAAASDGTILGWISRL